MVVIPMIFCTLCERQIETPRHWKAGKRHTIQHFNQTGLNYLRWMQHEEQELFISSGTPHFGTYFWLCYYYLLSCLCFFNICELCFCMNLSHDSDVFYWYIGRLWSHIDITWRYFDWGFMNNNFTKKKQNKKQLTKYKIQINITKQQKEIKTTKNREKKEKKKSS